MECNNPILNFELGLLNIFGTTSSKVQMGQALIQPIYADCTIIITSL